MQNEENGNYEKFLELLKPARTKLEKFAYKITGNYEDAKDLVNETILQVLIGFNKLTDEKCFVSYLFTVAYRINGKNIKKKKGNEKKIDLNEYEEYNEYCSKDISPDIMLDIKLMYEAIETINKREKEALLLSAVEGYQLKEIAEIQKTSISNVKVRIYRAKENIRIKLGIKHK